MDLELNTEDRDQSVREQQPRRAVFNCCFKFRRFTRYSIPVDNPWLTMLMIFIAGLCIWGLAANWLLSIFWPSLLGHSLENGLFALHSIPCGFIVGVLFYWLFGGLMWVASHLARFGLSFKTVRHIVLFAGVPIYLLALGCVSFSIGMNVLGIQPFKLGGINNWTSGTLFMIGFVILFVASLILSMLRLHDGLRGENNTTFSSFCLGIMLPVILFLSLTKLTRNPSFVTQIMADNIEKAMHDKMSKFGPVAPRQFVSLGIELIPDSDKVNHLRFAFMGLPSYGLDLTRGMSQLDYLDSLRNEAPRDSRVYQQIRAEIGLHRKDYLAAVRGYSNLIKSDSNDSFHRQRLVLLLLSPEIDGYDPETAITHVQYLRRAADKRLYEMLYGACLFHLGNYSEAYDILLPLTENDPLDSPTLFLMARTCAELGRYGEALRLLDQAANSEDRNEWFVQTRMAVFDELRELIKVLDQEDSFDQ